MESSTKSRPRDQPIQEYCFKLIHRLTVPKQEVMHRILCMERVNACSEKSLQTQAVNFLFQCLTTTF